MGTMSRARVLGYRSAVAADGRSYIYRPAHRRKRARRVVAMGQYTSHSSAAVSGVPPSRWAAMDAEMSSRFPALSEYLTEQLTEEGAPRVTSTIQVSCEDSLWKVALTDRAQKGGTYDYKLWRSGVTLLDALRAVDEALQSGVPDWRKFPKWIAPRRS